jgi:hypothetical protein
LAEAAWERAVERVMEALAAIVKPQEILALLAVFYL